MPELVGPIQSIELASWLWLIVFFPFVGALGNALYSSGFAGGLILAMRRGLSDGDTEDAKSGPLVVATARTSARIATFSLGLSAVAALVYSIDLCQLPSGQRFLTQPLWQLVRVGQLDVGFDLAFDPLAALMVVLVTVLGTVVAASLARSVTNPDAAWRLHAWFGFFIFSLLVATLADNFLVVLIGWECAGLAGVGLVGPFAAGARTTRTWVFLIQRGAEAGLILGIALLFWGLAGSWSSEGAFQSDLDPRISAVQVVANDAASLSMDDPALRGGAATKGKGFLTVTGLPGALVYMDESRTPITDSSGLPLTTPFSRHEVDGGAHAFRVAPDDRFRSAGHDAKVAYTLEGGILANYAVPRMAMGGDREVALAVLGPTLKFRELSDELSLSSTAGPHESRERVGHPIRERFTARKACGPVRVATLACILLLLGATAKSSDLFLRRTLPPDPGPAAALTRVHGGGLLLTGVYLMVRVWFLFALSFIALGALELLLVIAALFSGALVVQRWRARVP
jgi:NADH-quinone oxidoreductase subunit L